ncbi:MAG: porin family protein [Bacteroidales bacterium]
MFSLSGQVASAQESPVWDKPALRDSIIALLSKYQILHNKLNNQTDPSVEREFIHLFPNTKVQVVNDLEGQSKTTKISIEEYIIKVSDLFPDGLTINLDLARLTIDQPKYDRNNRYIIKIRINRSLNGISGGKVFSSNQRTIFQIAFFYNNNSPGSFAFYGMDLPPKGQNFITASVSPALSGFVNSALGSDERLSLRKGTGYMGGIFYSYYFSDYWGIGSGAQFSQYSGSVSLGKFDAFGGFDPNFRDVLIDNDLWFVEVPVFLSCRTNPSKRWEFRADLGLSIGIRVFESMTSSAVNTNTGVTMVNVITDTDWISLINRFNFGLQGTIAIKYRFNNRLGILVGGGMRQGLSGLDNNIHNDFVSSKYLGQYNPLWGAPGKTVNQAFFVNLGAAILLNKEQN